MTSFAGAGCTSDVRSRTLAVKAVNFTFWVLKEPQSTRTYRGISVNVAVRIL